MIFLKVRLICILFIVCPFLLFSGCAKNQTGNSDTSESENANIISYSAKENTDENSIYYGYPQFDETVPNSNELNGLIIESVDSSLQILCEGGFHGNLKDSPEKSELYNNDYTLQGIDFDYKITLHDANYFSVTFEGLYNNRAAAHPTNYFNSLTIDTKSCERVILSDLYHIDMKFVELLIEKYKEQIRTGLGEKLGLALDEIPESVEDELSSLDDELLLESLLQADKNGNYGFFSFLTDTALGISVPVKHAVGDHFEVMIKYDELNSMQK